MKLTYQLQQLISQTPNGLKVNMTAAQLTTYNTKEAEKEAMTQELWDLMQLDRDI